MRFLSDEETVTQLLRLMKENGREATGAELSCLIAALDSMEQQYRSVLAELEDVKKQLEQTQAPSVRDRLLGTLQTAQGKVEQALSQLSAVKEKVITWARSTLEDVKRFGINALDGAISALGIHKLLESMRDKVCHAMEGVNAAVERAEAVGQELRSAGGHLKNAGRAAVGKEVRQIDGGQAGRVQAVVLTPLRAAHSSLSGINRTISTAEGAAHRLDRAAEQGRGKRERPSVRRRLAQKKAAIPAPPGSGLLRKTREAER